MIRTLLLLTAFTTMAQAEEIVLKSGGRAILADIGIVQAPDVLGGVEAGNVLNLTFATRNWTPDHLEQDTRSLCLVQGQKSHAELLQSWQEQDDERRQMLSALGFDVEADLVGINIIMQPADQSEGVTVGYRQLFDMRRLTKCRVVER